MWLKLTTILLCVNLFATAVVAVLLFAPVELDIIYNEPFPVYPSEVKRGEEITWIVEFSKSNTFPATINRTIICADGNLVTLTSSETNVPKTERMIAVGGAVIPEKTSLGVCYTELVATYHINPLRNIEKTMRTQNFTVIE
jgi:hypothetical protein